MDDHTITRQRIDELLRFVPLLDRASEETEPEWTGLSQSPDDGVYVFPHPVYPRAVSEFFRLAAQEWWCDFEYDPVLTGDMLRSDHVVAEATLPEIKSMLTFCVRGERFCDGHWAAMIAEGRIAAILGRLGELRASVP